MNKLPFFFALLIFTGIGSAAQAQTAPKHQHAAGAKNTQDYMTMQNGKMMMSHSGKMMPMTKNMTMADGTVCMTDGTCKAKDGTLTKMKEGEHCMMMNGKMMVHPGSGKRPMKAGTMEKMKM
ncbi:DUF6799 domain-containing protein [Hymenobacter guriensis]|jgi:hypothetical protein|uniref:DUF6799 domain-containing protein n=1 Tax=Hymenobacter guriensis TaxID=2793065 RepID=A0ABS0L6K1_9BACT|nr:DUF6799 domain-containing protein [Hymenobacter guriensis]MBG8555773.1 hypothetical protein [Hymenobacter guriensis]